MFKKESFSKWLETGLQTMKNKPAYCLNIYDEDDEWTCELVGTNKFYKDGNDWYFDETKVFRRDKPFVLITQYSTGNYKKILDAFSKMLEKIIHRNKNIKDLVANKPFAYGFVDGELLFVDTCEHELS